MNSNSQKVYRSDYNEDIKEKYIGLAFAGYLLSPVFIVALMGLTFLKFIHPLFLLLALPIFAVFALSSAKLSLGNGGYIENIDEVLKD